MNTENCRSLLEWYGQTKRELPWRQTLDPYAVTVSEFMLQQTTVSAVLPKFRSWMQRFPDFKTLAESEESSVLTQWSGLGYYQRARRLQRVAQEVVRLGYVPDTFSGLQKLPGIGPYTAAAVASICFGRPHLAVDTNVIRVLFRYYALEHPPQNKSAHDELRQKMTFSLNSSDPGELNQALMELGATVCKVREPGCLVCPLSSGCQGLRSPGGPTRLPIQPERKKPVVTRGRTFVCRNTSDDSVLLARGTSLGLLMPLFQPPILFSKEESEEQFHLAVSSLGQRLAEIEQIHDWTLRYGISGRRLELECSRWDLGPEEFCQLVSLLEKKGLTVALLPNNQKEETLPLSTLTRKILQKCWGSP